MTVWLSSRPCRAYQIADSLERCSAVANLNRESANPSFNVIRLVDTQYKLSRVAMFFGANSHVASPVLGGSRYNTCR